MPGSSGGLVSRSASHGSLSLSGSQWLSWDGSGSRPIEGIGVSLGMGEADGDEGIANSGEIKKSCTTKDKGTRSPDLDDVAGFLAQRPGRAYQEQAENDKRDDVASLLESLIFDKPVDSPHSLHAQPSIPPITAVPGTWEAEADAAISLPKCLSGSPTQEDSWMRLWGNGRLRSPGREDGLSSSEIRITSIGGRMAADDVTPCAATSHGTVAERQAAYFTEPVGWRGGEASSSLAEAWASHAGGLYNSVPKGREGEAAEPMDAALGRRDPQDEEQHDVTPTSFRGYQAARDLPVHRRGLSVQALGMDSSPGESNFLLPSPAELLSRGFTLEGASPPASPVQAGSRPIPFAAQGVAKARQLKSRFAAETVGKENKEQHLYSLARQQDSGSCGRIEEASQEPQEIIPKPGYALARDYAVDSIVGEGRFGMVWKFIHKQTKVAYACKQVDKAHREDLQRELQCLAAVQGHPNVLSLVDVFEGSSCIYVLTELCDGGDLYDYLQRNWPIRESEARDMFCQLAEGLKHCHSKGVVHRDLKPENVLLHRCSESGRLVAKLADFGLSIQLKEGEFASGWVGSRPYEAPEVVSKVPYSFPADVFSLGVVLFGMVSGAWPNFSPGQRFCPEKEFTFSEWQRASPEVRDLVMRMLTLGAEGRPSVEGILEDPWLGCDLECGFENTPHGLSDSAMHWETGWSV